MEFKTFSLNGELLPIEQATVSLACLEYTYGFGVYETMRVSNGYAHFLQEHIDRLIESANIIGLEHLFSEEFFKKSVSDLVGTLNGGTYNLKMLLIGAADAAGAKLFIQCLNPLFPDKKLHRDGADFITAHYERVYPHAKTLNMLQSYMAYRKAKSAGSYDALLVNREGYITEGTRTNFFCIKDRTIFTPQEKDILLGVTRLVVLRAAIQNGFSVVEKNIRPDELGSYDGAFITSTSSKIIPIRSVDGIILYEKPAESIWELINVFDIFLSEGEGVDRHRPVNVPSVGIEPTSQA